MKYYSNSFLILLLDILKSASIPSCKLKIFVGCSKSNDLTSSQIRWMILVFQCWIAMYVRYATKKREAAMAKHCRIEMIQGDI